ncbi:MAG: MATE family efflux transporter, partial [Bullifex sp.]
FALPLAAGNLLQQCYNVADTLIVGRTLGPDVLAAVGSSFTLMTFLTSVILGLSLGSGTLFSLRFGEGDDMELKRSANASFCLIAAVTLVMVMLSFLSITFLERALNVPPTVWHHMKTYLLVIFTGLPAVFLYNWVSSYLRSLGNSKTPLVFLAVSAVLNIVLDLLFIMTFRLGAGGAAAATVISQYAAGVGICLFASRDLKAIVLSGKPEGKRMKSVASFSFLTCLQQSVMNLGILMVQGVVNSFGPVIMAAFAAAVKIDAFAYMPAQDFGSAVSTFLAQNRGAGKSERVRKGLVSGIVTSSLYCITASVIIFVFSNQLMGLFTSDETIIAEGVKYLRTEGAFYVLIGLLFILYGLFRALEKPVISLILTVISLGTRVLLAYTLPVMTGITGVWMAVPIGWALADITGFAVYILGGYLGHNTEKGR